MLRNLYEIVLKNGMIYVGELLSNYNDGIVITNPYKIIAIPKYNINNINDYDLLVFPIINFGDNSKVCIELKNDEILFKSILNEMQIDRYYNLLNQKKNNESITDNFNDL